MSINTTPTDYYILLDLNAWYGWNELTLMDMFSIIHVGGGSGIVIILSHAILKNISIGYKIL